MNNYYRKPIYDPFEVFNPSKTFILEVIKQLKQQAYEQLKIIQWYKEDRWPADLPEARLKKINDRIKNYQYRLQGNKRIGSWKASDGLRSFTEYELGSAKNVPIETIFPGLLRRRGTRLVGHCPFHSDKTPSFTVYLESNSYFCYSCGSGGDVIAFIQQLNGLSFREAVKFLIN